MLRPLKLTTFVASWDSLPEFHPEGDPIPEAPRPSNLEEFRTIYGSAVEAVAGRTSGERPTTPERSFPAAGADGAFNPGLGTASLVRKTDRAYKRVTRSIDIASQALSLATQAYKSLDESLDRHPVDIHQCKTYNEALQAVYHQTEEFTTEMKKVAEALQLTAHVVKTVTKAFKHIPAIPTDFTAITDLVALIRRLEVLYHDSHTRWDALWDHLHGTPDIVSSMQSILTDFAQRLDDMPQAWNDVTRAMICDAEQHVYRRIDEVHAVCVSDMESRVKDLHDAFLADIARHSQSLERSANHSTEATCKVNHAVQASASMSLGADGPDHLHHLAQRVRALESAVGTGGALSERVQSVSRSCAELVPAEPSEAAPALPNSPVPPEFSLPTEGPQETMVVDPLLAAWAPATLHERVVALELRVKQIEARVPAPRPIAEPSFRDNLSGVGLTPAVIARLLEQAKTNAGVVQSSDNVSALLVGHDDQAMQIADVVGGSGDREDIRIGDHVCMYESDA